MTILNFFILTLGAATPPSLNNILDCVSLRHHWIDPVIQGISQGFKDIDRFTLKLDKLAVYLNDERTRTFVGLEATGGVPQLSKLSKVNSKTYVYIFF